MLCTLGGVSVTGGVCRSHRLYGFAQLGVMPSMEMLEAVGTEAQRQLPAFGPQVRPQPRVMRSASWHAAGMPQHAAAALPAHLCSDWSAINRCDANRGGSGVTATALTCMHVFCLGFFGCAVVLETSPVVMRRQGR